MGKGEVYLDQQGNIGSASSSSCDSINLDDVEKIGKTLAEQTGLKTLRKSSENLLVRDLQNILLSKPDIGNKGNTSVSRRHNVGDLENIPLSKYDVGCGHTQKHDVSSRHEIYLQIATKMRMEKAQEKCGCDTENYKNGENSTKRNNSLSESSDDVTCPMRAEHALQSSSEVSHSCDTNKFWAAIENETRSCCLNNMNSFQNELSQSSNYHKISNKDNVEINKINEHQLNRQDNNDSINWLSKFQKNIKNSENINSVSLEKKNSASAMPNKKDKTFPITRDQEINLIPYSVTNTNDNSLNNEINAAALPRSSRGIMPSACNIQGDVLPNVLPNEVPRKGTWNAKECNATAVRSAAASPGVCGYDVKIRLYENETGILNDDQHNDAAPTVSATATSFEVITATTTETTAAAITAAAPPRSTSEAVTSEEVSSAATISAAVSSVTSAVASISVEASAVTAAATTSATSSAIAVTLATSTSAETSVVASAATSAAVSSVASAATSISAEAADDESSNDRSNNISNTSSNKDSAINNNNNPHNDNVGNNINTSDTYKPSNINNDNGVTDNKDDNSIDNVDNSNRINNINDNNENNNENNINNIENIDNDNNIDNHNNIDNSDNRNRNNNNENHINNIENIYIDNDNDIDNNDDNSNHNNNNIKNVENIPSNSSGGRQVPSLERQCVEATLSRLACIVWSWRDDDMHTSGHRDLCATSFRRQVPPHIRRLLQESVLAEWRVWDTVQLRLLQLLLWRDCCSAVRVQQVRLFFRDPFLQLLPRLSTLTDLRIQDSSWRLQKSQEEALCRAVSSMPALRLLSLRYIATDAVIVAVANNCHNLQILDVFCSSGVTLAGAMALVGRQHHLPPKQIKQRRRWWPFSFGHFRGLLAGASRIKRKRGSSVISVPNTHRPAAEQFIKRLRADSEPMPKLNTATELQQHGNNNKDDGDDLCVVLPMLLYLDLRGTMVSAAGAKIIDALMPVAEVLYLSSAAS